MTKEECLQRVNEYCNERSYDDSTLTTDFKDKFADFFSKKYPDTAVDDETALADLKFNLDTAKSASSRGRASLQQGFESKESDYRNQIEELNKKLGKKTTVTKVETVIPKEIQEQLDELKRFKNDEAKKTKFKDIMDIAKKGIRESLHKSFETFAMNIGVSLDKDAAEQAKEMVASFQNIFMDTVGDIKPLAPKQKMHMEDEMIKSVKKVTL